MTSVPTHRLIAKLPFGAAAAKQEIELNERQPEPEEETVEDLTPRGQILWIRGLTRLQHQVCQSMANYVVVTLTERRRFSLPLMCVLCKNA